METIRRCGEGAVGLGQQGRRETFYPHHMDAEWCWTQHFERRMAHGILVFSVGVGITQDSSTRGR
jgi:hypothetical protein